MTKLWLFASAVILMLHKAQADTSDLGDDHFDVKLKTFGQRCKQSEKEYCITVRGLVCSEASICECPEGQIWVPRHGGHCRLPVGSLCNPGLFTNLEARCTDGAYCKMRKMAQTTTPKPKKGKKSRKSQDEDQPELTGVCKCIIKNCHNGARKIGLKPLFMSFAVLIIIDF